MKKHLKNNILIYFAIIGGLGFIPLIAELKITRFTLISLLVGLVWTIGFLSVWFLNNYYCCKKHFSKLQSNWTDCEEFTGYFRFKNYEKTLIKIDGFPCESINIHTIYLCHTDIIKLNNKLVDNIVYVKRG